MTINDYYDPTLKQRRLEQLLPAAGFRFVRMDLGDRAGMEQLFAREGFPYVIHLAAQAGVRYSLQNPHAYVDFNLVGFVNVLEGCRRSGCRHLVYASSSSVYGANTRLPFRTQDNVDHPISLYAATKKANELMAHSYAHLYGLASTGLRFFTVYGPWGRPDMAMWLFTKAIVASEPIRLFDYGRARRDFTSIGDVVEAVVRLVRVLPAPDPAWSGEAAPDPSTSYAPWRIHNIGGRDHRGGPPAGGSHRPPGRKGVGAASVGRRRRHLRRRGKSRSCGRLPTGYTHQGGDRPLRSLDHGLT